MRSAAPFASREGWHPTPSTDMTSEFPEVTPSERLQASGRPWFLPQDHGTTRRLEGGSILSPTTGRSDPGNPPRPRLHPCPRRSGHPLEATTTHLGRPAHGLERRPEPGRPMAAGLRDRHEDPSPLEPRDILLWL